MRVGRRGQYAWMDAVLVLVIIILFTGGVWFFGLNPRSNGAYSQMRTQDYTESLLLSAMYCTPEPDGRLEGKTLSDLLAMYFSYPESVGEDDMMDAVSGCVEKSLGGRGAEWFFYDADREDICVYSLDGAPSDCRGQEQIKVTGVSSANAIVFYHSTDESGSMNMPSVNIPFQGGTQSAAPDEEYEERIVFFSIVWSRS